MLQLLATGQRFGTITYYTTTESRGKLDKTLFRAHGETRGKRGHCTTVCGCCVRTQKSQKNVIAMQRDMEDSPFDFAALVTPYSVILRGCILRTCGGSVLMVGINFWFLC